METEVHPESNIKNKIKNAFLIYYCTSTQINIYVVPESKLGGQIQPRIKNQRTG